MPQYDPAPDRYQSMPYRRCGRSGVMLPALSLGLWHNFGDDRPLEVQRSIVRRAFDLGITYFDLANNYGPPYGSAETNFGSILHSDFGALRDELIISTKAGWDMWPGPYGDHGSRKYLLASLDQSLRPPRARLRRHLLPPSLRPRHAARGDHGCARTRQCVRARRSTSASRPTRTCARGRRWRSCARWAHRCSSISPRTPCSTAGSRTGSSMFWARRASGASAFSPLAQGLLTDRYLHGIPAGSRASRGFVAVHRHVERRESRPRPRPRRHRGATGPEGLPAGVGVGAARSPRDVPRHRCQQRRASSRRTWRRWATSTSPPRNSRRSTSTPSTAASTCGGGRRRAEPDAAHNSLTPTLRARHIWE